MSGALKKPGRFLPVLIALLAGCSFYSKQADWAAYRTVRYGQWSVLGQPKAFDVVYSPLAAEDRGAAAVRVGEKRIPVGRGNAVPLTLAECLEIAARNSRALQNDKEGLYQSALALANATRSWFWPAFGGSLEGEATHTRRPVVETVDGKEVVHGVEAGAGSGTARMEITRRLMTGGVLTLALATNFVTDWVGWGSTTVGSLVEVNFSQPLLRGLWRMTEFEALDRQERDFLIDVYEHERFTQTHAAEIATGYFQVLQRRDALENERENIKRLEQTMALTRVLVEGGERSPIEKDQAEQDLLNARVRLERTEQEYRDALDAFKITLGLPLLARIEPDYAYELARLQKAGPRPVPMAEPEAILTAFQTRPDVLTSMARVRDAEKDADLAADEFLPRLDFTYNLKAPSSGEKNRFHRTDFNRYTGELGVAFEYDIDQTDNRDAFRQALIAHERSKRDHDQLLDTVRREVRDAYRSLLQTRHSYDLQRRSVAVAARRRKLAALEQKEGEASARDVLEAEEALRNAQNGLTNALISYTTTRLQFLASLGLIRVDGQGQLVEARKPFLFVRLGRRYKYLRTQG